MLEEAAKVADAAASDYGERQKRNERSGSTVFAERDRTACMALRHVAREIRALAPAPSPRSPETWAPCAECGHKHAAHLDGGMDLGGCCGNDTMGCDCPGYDPAPSPDDGAREVAEKAIRWLAEAGEGYGEYECGHGVPVLTGVCNEPDCGSMWVREALARAKRS